MVTTITLYIYNIVQRSAISYDEWLTRDYCVILIFVSFAQATTYVEPKPVKYACVEQHLVLIFSNL